MKLLQLFICGMLPLSLVFVPAAEAGATQDRTLTLAGLRQPERAAIATESMVADSEGSAPVAVKKPQEDLKIKIPDDRVDATTLRRRQLLIEADRLYLSGDRAAAEQLYRRAKDPRWKEQGKTVQRPEPILDPANLPPGGQVYWRESTAGMEAGLETRTLVPLQLLVEQYPAFIPGHIRLAELLQQYDRPEEALQRLEQAANLYPNQPDLVRVRVAALANQEQWLDASIAARQFALLNPDDPSSAEFLVLADEYLDEFQDKLRSRLTANTIANVITGAVGFALTGSLFGPLTGLDSALTLLQGEESIGRRVAERAQEQLPMVEDEDVNAYVNEIGQRLAQVTGRDEFEYEFFVVMDDRLNAFALPGGKVFVNAGAIVQAESEAELAGLLAHELAHSVLSHGFQIVTSGNLTANLTQYLPLGDTVANLLVLSYSRDMERQADQMGAQLLASSGYAADGLYNLMITLEEQEENPTPFTWLSSHPAPGDRVEELAAMIEQGGYNRYVYEGVERHLEVRERVKYLLARYEAEQRQERQRHIEGKLRTSEQYRE